MPAKLSTSLQSYASLVKFSHTIFAMPFALIGFFSASHLSGYGFEVSSLFLVILCMIFARNAAMAFNRYADRTWDQQNPRTAIREIPAKVISPRAALSFVIINAVAFIITTGFINKLCFYLSPLALLIILGYSYTKRFTWLCHLVLGMGLSLAPVGAYLAVAGVFDTAMVLYGLTVLFWVSGFDIIYALQDIQFDQKYQLRSIPAFLGAEGALTVSAIFHLLSASFLITVAFYTQFGLLAWTGVACFLGLLFYQHRLVKRHKTEKINMAFFTTNGLASFALASFIILEIFLQAYF